jgi:hypothetical protein
MSLTHRTAVCLGLLSLFALGQPALEPQGNCRIDANLAILGGTSTLSLDGPGGAPFSIAFDTLPGVLPVPGVGTIWLGFTPGLTYLVNGLFMPGPPLPASGQFSLSVTWPPSPALDGALFFVQAGAGAPTGIALSNALSVQAGFPDSYHPTLGVMNAPRAFHRVVPLQNGALMVIGGGAGAFLSPAATDTCERYDAYHRTFVADTPMGSPRTLHRATGLTDGRVFASGGSLTLGAGLNTTELYDPASQAWTPGPNLSSNRIAHTATLLDDGRVLLCGGASNFTLSSPTSTNYMPIFSSAQNTAEIFDPATGTLTPTANLMSNARIGAAAVKLPSGKVLIAGGVRGGFSFFGIGTPLYAQFEDLFDPATNSFTSVPALVQPRFGHTLNVRGDGKVVAIGGAGGALVISLGTTEVFTESGSSGFWTAGPNLPGGASTGLHTAVTLADGSIYVAGGAIGALGSFNPIDTNWRMTASGVLSTLNLLPVAIQAHTAHLTPAGVVLIGGSDVNQSVDTARIWTPTL